MRDDIPKDFDAKVLSYEKIGAHFIVKYSIPCELWINADETNILFCMRASRSRAPKGARKVRVLGVGKDKGQITGTLGVAGDGDVFPIS
jgi:hypothetical protein